MDACITKKEVIISLQKTINVENHTDRYFVQATSTNLMGGAEDGIVVLDDQKTGILNRSPISSDDSHVTCDSLHHVAKPQKIHPKLSKKERIMIIAERDRNRLEMKAKKEAERQAKMEERKKKEEERKEKKEKEELERREKKEKREAERKRKMEEMIEKQVAKKIKKMIKKEKEREEDIIKEEKIRKEQLVKQKFLGFFSKPNGNQEFNNNTNNKRTIITPFELPRQPFSNVDYKLFDTIVQEQIHISNYLKNCKRKSGCHDNNADDDVLIISPSNEKKRFKLLQFHENYRPAYWGTFSKTSNVITSRNPFRKHEGLLDYTVDSDDDWEEEDPGESISHSEDEKGDSGDEEDDNDGFFVPHGYLSEDEGELSDGEMSKDNREKKQLANVKAWEVEFTRKCQPLKPICVGIVWTAPSSDTSSHNLLTQFAAVTLLPIPIPTLQESGSNNGEHGLLSVPEQAMPDLIRLVHCSNIGMKRLIDIFRSHWAAVKNESLFVKSTPNQEENVVHNDMCHHPSGISKRQLEQKITNIATKETRPHSNKPLWYVHTSVLQQYGFAEDKVIPLEIIGSPQQEAASSNKKIGNKKTPCNKIRKMQDFFKTPPDHKTTSFYKPHSENVARCLSLSEPPTKKQRLDNTTPDDATIIEDSCDKENESPPSTDGVKDATSFTGIDWDKQLVECNKIIVPIDIHI